MTVLHRFAIGLVALSVIGCNAAPNATPNATSTPAPSAVDSSAAPVEKPPLDAQPATGGNANSAAPQPSEVANSPQGSAQLSPTPASATLPFINDCEPTESVFTVIETEDYRVSICGGDLPNTYVGVNKDNNERIRLPLAQYEPDGSLFEAVNGDVSYLLVRNTPKGSFLTVTQGTRELLRQPALSWE